MVCFGMTVTVLLAPLFEETYVPAILARQAKAKRDQTGDWAWHSAVDRVKITPRDIVVRYLLRPLRMLFTEPSESNDLPLMRQSSCTVLLVISIYMSFVYALLYMLMAALPIIYHEIRGYSPVVSSLPLVSVFIGILFGGGIIILDMYRYARVCQLRPEAAVPEQRFFPMGLGAFLLREFRPAVAPADLSSHRPVLVRFHRSGSGDIALAVHHRLDPLDVWYGSHLRVRYYIHHR
jgi:DHA1 family multidrug resistance protein-like MFS transporter